MTPRSSIRVGVLAALALAATACGSPKALIKFRVDPPSATIFVNGKSEGDGTQSVPLSFVQGNRRVIVQVVAEGYKPWRSVYTWAQVAEMRSEEFASVVLDKN
jgi:hypothetical protein